MQIIDEEKEEIFEVVLIDNSCQVDGTLKFEEFNLIFTPDDLEKSSCDFEIMSLKCI